MWSFNQYWNKKEHFQPEEVSLVLLHVSQSACYQSAKRRARSLIGPVAGYGWRQAVLPVCTGSTRKEGKQNWKTVRVLLLNAVLPVCKGSTRKEGKQNWKTARVLLRNAVLPVCKDFTRKEGKQNSKRAWVLFFSRKETACRVVQTLKGREDRELVDPKDRIPMKTLAVKPYSSVRTLFGTSYGKRTFKSWKCHQRHEFYR